MLTNCKKSASQITNNIFIFAIFIGFIFFLRRPMQFLDPQVWVEDGTQLLPQMLQKGFSSFLTPVNGYLVITSRVISYISCQFGLKLYPYIGTYFGLLFDVFTVVYLAFTPSLLKKTKWLALAVVFLPTNVEVFILPSYAFWFAGLLLIGIVFRDDHQSKLLLTSDVFLAVLCGLSCPLVVAIVPLLLFRLVYISKFKGSYLIFILLLLTALIQAYYVFQFTHNDFGVMSISELMSIYLKNIWGTINTIILKYFGWNIGYWTTGSKIIPLFFGYGFFGFITFLSLYNKEKTIHFLFLALVLTILLSIVRVDVNTINPHNAGPRYFFYPWILLWWLMLQLFVSNNKHIKRCIMVLVIMGMFQYILSWQRGHEHLDWQGAVKKFESSGKAEFPVQYDGSKKRAWSIVL